MTSTQIDTSERTRKHISDDEQFLRNMFGDEVTNAFSGLAREKALDVFAKTHEELTQLQQRVVALHEQHGSTPEVKKAATAVSGAAKAHNDAGKDGEPTEQEVAADKQRTDKAAKTVKAAEDSVEGRLGKLEDRIKGVEDDHTNVVTKLDEVLTAVQQKQGGSQNDPNEDRILKVSFIVTVCVFAFVAVIYVATSLIGGEGSLWNGMAISGFFAFFAGFATLALYRPRTSRQEEQGSDHEE